MKGSQKRQAINASDKTIGEIVAAGDVGASFAYPQVAVLLLSKGQR